MSTLTISAPIAAPRRGRSRTAVATRRCGDLSRPRVTSRPVPVAPQRPRATTVPRAKGQLRLTRRGRLAILMLLLALGAVVSLAVTSSGLASSTATAAPVQYVTVAPGDTLWSIASDVAPDADPRDTVAEIVERNALDGSAIQAGQRIAVPLAR